jgi:hypothetical protein
MRSSRLALLVGLLTLVSGPAWAQIDLTGSWRTRMYEDFFERGPGSDLADFTGLPLNDEARAKGLKYDPTTFAMRERQCLSFSPWAILYQPLDTRIWSESDADGRIVAWKLAGNVLKDVVTIWMDGRPHPSDNAFRAASGFTTGKWEGDTLTARTTNLKTNELRRGTGIPTSDRATITAHLTRHDNFLTITTIEEDPVYLTEPHVVSRVFELDPRANVQMWNVCMAQTEIPRLEDSGIVPHHLPDQNPQEFFLSKTYNIPQEAAMGHAETLYPEYRKKLRATYKAPERCTRYCCGWLGFEGLPDSAPGLRCIIGGGYGALDQQLLKEYEAENRQKK